jgi:hypothetical protein
MNNPRTTIFGGLAAAAVAASQVEGIPERWKTVLVVLGAVFGSLFAFFAKDATPTPKLPGRVLCALIVPFGLLIAAGCTLAHFRTAVSSPTFGSLSVSIGGGTIGNRPQDATVTTITPSSASVSTPKAATTNNPPQPKKETKP